MAIDRGRRNQEILKQPQYAPVAIEHQVATVYASTKGLLDKVPVEKVKEFDTEFLTVLSAQHSDTLAALRAGKLDNSVTDVIDRVAREIAAKY